MCAIAGGRSLDTTMGLTPVSGLPGATRSGAIDPALIFHYTNRAGRISHDPALAADPGGGHWFNLNSFNHAPERIGKLYLGMFLQQAQQEGTSPSS